MLKQLEALAEAQNDQGKLAVLEYVLQLAHDEQERMPARMLPATDRDQYAVGWNDALAAVDRVLSGEAFTPLNLGGQVSNC